jgi:hypothetical protein
MLAAEEEAIRTRQEQLAAEREQAFREKMARMEAEHERMLQDVAARVKSAEAVMEEKARTAALAEQRAQEEVCDGRVPTSRVCVSFRKPYC